MKTIFWGLVSIFTALLTWSGTASALSFPLPQAGNSVVGQTYVVRASGGETLGQIGRRHDIGFYEMVEANPNLNPHRIQAGTRVVIPAQFILPDTQRKGIVINLAELRLYYYPKDRAEVITMPVGIGRQGWQTPVGVTTVIGKKVDPIWRPTKNIRANAAKHGVYFPEVVYPGPENPLGRYAMRLGLPSYLIHSTNQPSGVGERVSSGCIRMYPEDIERLYPQVPVGTRVEIVNEPFKVGWLNNELYLEAHYPLAEFRAKYGSGFGFAQDRINEITNNSSSDIDWGNIRQVLRDQKGIPFVVGSRFYNQMVDGSSRLPW